MKYTPRDISHQTFPGSLGGFNKQAVKNFLNDVAADTEALLQSGLEQSRRIEALEAELQRMRGEQDEIRRVIVATERMAHEMKEQVIRESEILTAQAQAHAQEIQHEQELRSAQLETAHQERMAALEIAFRNRYTDLEREHHELTLDRERQHAERVAHLEKQFGDQYLDLTSRMNAARQEYTQFLNGYRALVGSFAELSQRHSLPDTPPLPQHNPAQHSPAQPNPVQTVPVVVERTETEFLE